MQINQDNATGTANNTVNYYLSEQIIEAHKNVLEAKDALIASQADQIKDLKERLKN